MDLYQTYILPVATTYFLTFCKYYNEAKNILFNIYTTNELVKIVTDNTYTISTQLYCFLTSQKIEPEILPWISTAWMLYSPDKLTQQLYYNEKYNFMDIVTTDLFKQSDRDNYANQYFSKISEDFTQEKLDPIVILKTVVGDDSSEEVYIVRRMSSKYDKLSFEKTAAKFISIEYNHPDMSSPIELNMDRSWFFAGNEILNSTFILRLLNYQSVMYFFDEDYIIKIMDSDCNIFTITYGEHILLTPDGYEVRTITDATVIDPIDQSTTVYKLDG